MKKSAMTMNIDKLLSVLLEYYMLYLTDNALCYPKSPFYTLHNRCTSI